MTTTLKDKAKGFFKDFSFGIPASIICIVLGVLLLIWPEIVNNILVYVIAGVFALGGVILIVRYFRGDAVTGMKQRPLMIGLIALAIGVVLFLKPGLPAGILPFIWGVALAVGAFYKFQIAMDMRRMKDKHWIWSMVGAVVSLALGLLSVFKPFGIALIFLRFIGGALIVEGVTDIASDAWFIKARKKAYPNIEPGDKSSVE